MEEKEMFRMIKSLIERQSYDEAYEKITEGMKEQPDGAIWHNFLGILYEKQGKRSEGMKHFRAAWALEPAFLPARWNMELYGGCHMMKRLCAYLEEDCPKEEPAGQSYRVVYDEKGVGSFEPLERIRREKR